MGPTNVALVKLFLADQQLRQAQARLEAATKDVRIQERRVRDLGERHRLAGQNLREAQAKAGAMEVDLKSRDAHIERLRSQQQNAKNNKEYQNLLLQINTLKVDRNKVEDETMKLLEVAEKTQQELKVLAEQLAAEQAKLGQMKEQIHETIAALQSEIESRRPEREAAAAAVPPRAREAFERLAEHHDGEAMAPIAKPDRRREEYVCTACNMDLVTDVYNKLHSRDDLVFCPSCRRLLYIPEDLTPEVAVHKKKATKPRAAKAPPAAVPRQQSALDVMRSIAVEEEDRPASDASDASSDASSDAPSADASSAAPESDTASPPGQPEQAPASPERTEAESPSQVPTPPPT